MNKIPTLYLRSEDRRHVIDEVNPACEWVLDGEGRPTRKWDGTCVLIRRDGLAVHAFARREVKPGKNAPAGFVELSTDPVTGKTMGWEPMGQSGFAKFFDEAVTGDEAPGTYELVGPKINGNPEGLDRHVLMRHGDVAIHDLDDSTYDGVNFQSLHIWLLGHDWEGIVWHHPDGRMAKIKLRDFAPIFEVSDG